MHSLHLLVSTPRSLLILYSLVYSTGFVFVGEVHELDAQNPGLSSINLTNVLLLLYNPRGLGLYLMCTAAVEVSC